MRQKKNEQVSEAKCRKFCYIATSKWKSFKRFPYGMMFLISYVLRFFSHFNTKTESERLWKYGSAVDDNFYLTGNFKIPNQRRENFCYFKSWLLPVFSNKESKLCFIFYCC